MFGRVIICIILIVDLTFGSFETPKLLADAENVTDEKFVEDFMSSFRDHKFAFPMLENIDGYLKQGGFDLGELFRRAYPKKLRAEYDFVIVGSGAAGCALANRLSEDENTSVLLLEVGKEEVTYFTDVPLAAPNLQSTSYNWGYVAEKQSNACLGMIDGRCSWPHGRGLGGSTIINYMIYTRGNRHDYDRWAADGNTGWSYKDVLPYFMKAEHASLGNLTENGSHGHAGFMNVEFPPYRSSIVKAYVNAAQEAGFRLVDYNDGGNQLGVGYLQANTLNGQRFSAARAYLEPIHDRDNVDIAPQSWVTKLLFNKARDTVTGVLYTRDKKTTKVRARKEVILAAGSIESPKLLMLSGIGPADDLKALGIKATRDLPVGKTLYEHVGTFGPIYTAANASDQLINMDNVTTLDVISKYYKGKGPLTCNGVESLTYIRTNVSDNLAAGIPDIELMQALATVAFDTAPGTRSGLRISAKTYARVFKPLENQRAFMILPFLLQPQSSGHLKLKSSNPFKHPILVANYFDHPQDIKAILAGIREAQRIVRQPAFASLKLKAYEARVPGCELWRFDTDEYWECYIMHLTSTLHHQVGTCKMGPSNDRTSVVGPNLKVHGIVNLRVADTSVIPRPASGHTAAISVMIGEKLADMIKSDWQITSDAHNIRRRSISLLDLMKHHANETDNIHDILQPKHDEIKVASTSKPIVYENGHTANEDGIRMYNVPSHSKYGRGTVKPKKITELLSHMKTQEFTIKNETIL